MPPTPISHRFDLVSAIAAALILLLSTAHDVQPSSINVDNDYLLGCEANKPDSGAIVQTLVVQHSPGQTGSFTARLPLPSSLSSDPPPKAESSAHRESSPHDQASSDSHEPSPTESSSYLNLMAHGGLMSCHKYEGGFLVGAGVLKRGRLATVGVNAERGSLFMVMGSIGAMAGVSIQTGGGFHVDMLATGDVRHYSHWGRKLFGDDPGASATLPFLGAHFRPVIAFRDRRHRRYEFGGFLAIDRDLWRARRKYFYPRSHGFAEQFVGGTRLSAGFTCGRMIELNR